MAGEVNGIKFEQAKSLLDIDRKYNDGHTAQEEALFDIDKDGKLSVAENEALSAYLSNQDKVKFDFDQDGKLDKAEQAAYEAYTIQRADEKHEELVKDITNVLAHNPYQNEQSIKNWSNLELENFISKLPSEKEYDKAGAAARVILEYNKANNIDYSNCLWGSYAKTDVQKAPEIKTFNVPENLKSKGEMIHITEITSDSMTLSPEEFVAKELSNPNEFLSGPFQ